MNPKDQFKIYLEHLEDRMMLSSVDVFAAGVTNQETIELQVDGATVQVWNNVGGDAYGGDFAKLTFNTTEDLSGKDLRIVFTNDLFDPSGGIDRNVRIDKIVVDDVTYETESSDVFSTGTWKAADGIVDGFRESEYLHANGYFQYQIGNGNGGGTNLGSSIDIIVKGDEGTEQFNLLIKGQVVGTYSVGAEYQTISYQHGESFSADDVRIEFTNDQWDPSRGIDANLTVDKIVIDGTTFETEDQSVFSTGSWKSADGIEPGFGRSETLNSNGYFQYADSNSGGATNLSPVANKDYFDVEQGQTIWGDVGANDFDPDGNDGNLVFKLLTQPAFGQINFNADGTFEFTATGNNTGDIVFEYSVTDEQGARTISEACITVMPKVDRSDFDQDGKIDSIDQDDDNDGIADQVEIDQFGTDPFNSDSDGDGIQDGTEVGLTQGTPDSFGGPVSFRPDADPSTTTNPLNPDTDGDGLSDGVEDPNRDGASPRTIGGTGTTGSGETDPNNPDTDGDGLTDGQEVNQIGSNPLDTDTDDGSTPDGVEAGRGTDPVNNPGDDVLSDNDQDGKPDNIDTDDDNDGILDVDEAALGTNPFNGDTDGDGLQDGKEIGLTNAGPDSFGGPISFTPDLDPSTTTNPLNPDTDGDGLTDGQEDPNLDGASPRTIGGTGTTGSGETDPTNPDTDGDGLTDGQEVNQIGSNPLDTDTDDGSTPDGVEAGRGTNPVNNPNDDILTDSDQDGKPDNVDQDDDNDGIPDSEEQGIGTDPLNPDTDGDGIQDGTEVGKTSGTPDSFGGPVSFRPDADPTTTTNPLNPDTDGDGLTDGQEDPNADGASPRSIGGTGTTGSGETDPNNPDTDGDGLPDGQEVNQIGSNPLDTDTDDGTTPDGVEVNDQGTDPVNNPNDDVLADFDQDGKPDNVDQDDDNDGIPDSEEQGLGTDPLNPDTDGDGIQDGTEVGRTQGTPDSFGGPVSFRPDADPTTTTNPLNPDTDGDGLTDGQEDPNADGSSPRTIGQTGTTGSGETDPNNPDTDGDGLTDGQEVNQIGSNPLDTDTDDGTTPDGVEVNDQGTDPVNNPNDDVLADFDQDGKPDNVDTDDDNDGILDVDEPTFGTNPLNPDTDNDGIQDGTEVGRTSAGPDSFGGPVSFRPDADPSTTTDPLNPDTDGDGLTDGQEDSNADGSSPRTIGQTGTTGTGETDPNNPDTDGDGLTDGQEVNGTGSNPLDTDTDDGSIDDGVEVNAGNNPLDPADDTPIVATVIGLDPIQEGQTGSYRIQTDRPVLQDTTFVVNVNDITATKTIDPNAASQKLAWFQWWPYSEVVTDYALDYTVSQDGGVTAGQVTLTVLAGQTTSIDTFEVETFAEESAINLAYEAGGTFARKGRPTGFEGTESFLIDIVSSTGGQDITLIDRDVDILDTDRYYRYSPIALDLNGDGEIGVTGESTARDAVVTQIGETVQFDIDADGQLDTIEWFAGDGDGILVDVSMIGPKYQIDGSALFGDQGGQYANGYEKLSLLDSDGDGEISGSEAENLGLWIDDGDAILEFGELKSLDDFEIVSISSEMEIDSEGRMRSSAEKADGSKVMTEDVWFASEK